MLCLHFIFLKPGKTSAISGMILEGLIKTSLLYHFQNKEARVICHAYIFSWYIKVLRSWVFGGFFLTRRKENTVFTVYIQTLTCFIH